MPEFDIKPENSSKVGNEELADLLYEAYAAEGFIDPDEFDRFFQPDKIKARGNMICARNMQTGELCGMVILVGAGSEAKRFAEENEMEMHLLAVKRKYRNKGLGESLIKKLLSDAKTANASKVLLYTQKNMHAAHRLYDKLGFVRVPGKDFEKNARSFLVYEKNLNSSS